MLMISESAFPICYKVLKMGCITCNLVHFLAVIPKSSFPSGIGSAILWLFEVAISHFSGTMDLFLVFVINTMRKSYKRNRNISF